MEAVSSVITAVPDALYTMINWVAQVNSIDPKDQNVFSFGYFLSYAWLVVITLPLFSLILILIDYKNGQRLRYRVEKLMQFCIVLPWKVNRGLRRQRKSLHKRRLEYAQSGRAQEEEGNEHTQNEVPA